jgi:hypothetical protein
MDVEPTSYEKEAHMFRKSILALAAVAALGSVALAPTGAEAYWGGGYGRYGWYSKHNYQPFYYRGFYGPRYVYGGWKFGGWKRYSRYF